MSDQSGQHYSELREAIGVFAGPKRQNRLYLVCTPATKPDARIQRDASLQVWVATWGKPPTYKATIATEFRGEVQTWLVRLLTGADGQLVPLELDAVNRATTRHGSFVVEVRHAEDENYRILNVHRRVPVRN